MVWLEGSAGGALLRVWVQPRAAKAAIIGVFGDALKIKLTLPPVDGKANDQLLALVAARLNLPVSQIHLRAGRTGRRKLLEIEGLPVEQIESLLLP